MGKANLMENNADNDPILTEINKLDKNVKWILWIGAPILILIPILTTQLDWFFDFTNTGNIGDTLGGVTAPVIGVVSALLIYFSFRAQIGANRIIQNQINQQRKEEDNRKAFNHQMEIYDHLKGAFENFQYKVGGDVKTGSTAFFSFWNSSYLSGRKSAQIGSERAFESIIKLFEIIIDKLKLSKGRYVDIELVLFLTELQFNQYICETLGDKILNENKFSDRSSSIGIMINRIELIHIQFSKLKIV